MAVLKNIAGQQYGMLKAIEVSGKTKRGDAKWLCRCNCGEYVEVVGYNLRNGHTRSCGCLRAEISEWVNVTHGQSSTKDGRSPEYRTWTNMKSRCFNPRLKRYKDYGGRGITVCPEWADSFEQFYKDMGDRPSPRHSIDRIDVNGNYEPDNCRWATLSQQNRNKRNSRG